MGLRLFACGGVSLVAGLILVVFGVSFKWLLFPMLMQSEVYKQLELREGTEGYKAWVEPPVPVYMHFSFFHVANSKDVLDKSSKPLLEEYGPYVYREVRRKEDISEIGGDTLHYSTYMEYHFDDKETQRMECKNNREKGKCSPDDEYTVINAPLVGVAGLLKNTAGRPLLLPKNQTNELITELLDQMNTLLNGEQLGGSICRNCQDSLFVQSSVSQLLFEGKEYGVLKALKKALMKHSKLTLLLRLLGIKLSDLPSEFAFYGGKNGTKSGLNYAVNSGRYDKHRFLETLEFNGMTSLPKRWWPDAAPTPSAQAAGVKGTCKEIVGTDGSQFPAPVDREHRLWMFVSDLCRSIYVEYQQDTDVRGIPALEFRPSDDLFRMTNPDNHCYCPDIAECRKPAADGTDTWDMSDCLADSCKDGMIVVSGCQKGAPVVMTAPHFLRADPSLIEAVEDGGMRPDFDKHDTLVKVEPMTGVPLEAHKRIQVNLQVKQNAKLDVMGSAPEMVFPLLWADETATLDDASEEQYKTMVVSTFKIVDGVSIGLGIVLGTLIFCLGLGLCFRELNRGGQEAGKGAGPAPGGNAANGDCEMRPRKNSF